jgi:hypothetical protein
MMRSRLWLMCNWALLLRGIEIVLMLALPSIWSQGIFVQREFAISDVLALVTMFAGTAWLCIYTFRFSERLRIREQRAAHNL